jgi:hypothetical protein
MEPYGIYLIIQIFLMRKLRKTSGGHPPDRYPLSYLRGACLDLPRAETGRGGVQASGQGNGQTFTLPFLVPSLVRTYLVGPKAWCGHRPQVPLLWLWRCLGGPDAGIRPRLCMANDQSRRSCYHCAQSSKGALAFACRFHLHGCSILRTLILALQSCLAEVLVERPCHGCTRGTMTLACGSPLRGCRILCILIVVGPSLLAMAEVPEKMPSCCGCTLCTESARGALAFALGSPLRGRSIL